MALTGNRACSTVVVGISAAVLNDHRPSRVAQLYNATRMTIM